VKARIAEVAAVVLSGLILFAEGIGWHSLSNLLVIVEIPVLIAAVFLIMRG
jgi:hypothetical protein